MLRTNVDAHDAAGDCNVAVCRALCGALATALAPSRHMSTCRIAYTTHQGGGLILHNTTRG